MNFHGGKAGAGNDTIRREKVLGMSHTENKLCGGETRWVPELK